MAKITLPEKQPQMKIVDRDQVIQNWGKKGMPRAANADIGERFIRLDRPQNSPEGFAAYAVGHFLRATRDWVVVAAGKPFNGHYHRDAAPLRLQYVVCRPATDEDRAAVADAIEAQKAEDAAILARMVRG